jgi:hypothetical protein
MTLANVLPFWRSATLRVADVAPEKKVTQSAVILAWDERSADRVAEIGLASAGAAVANKRLNKAMTARAARVKGQARR